MQPERHPLYKKAAKTTPANPRPRMGWIISAAEALLVLVVEPELVLVEPEPEVEVDECEVVEEVAEEALEEEDFRLAELMVPLVPEEPLPDEPVGTMTVLFTPAGMEAAGA